MYGFKCPKYIISYCISIVKNIKHIIHNIIKKINKIK